ncbi:MAG: hydroxyacid dehydrogenase [Planctomycetota bacterium]|nr:hydroxyacid dehydrogenase [Planctomycetota bacterium]
MAAKPVVAIIVPKGTQKDVLNAETVARINERFDARWPKAEGKIDAAETLALLKDADGCMTGWGSPCLSNEVLAQCPKIKIMAHSAGSVKPFVSDDLWKRGILVTSAAAGIAVDVAHYAIGLMVIGRKNVMEVAPQVTAGQWRERKAHRASDDLRDCTVGIVAASHVGRNVMRLLQPFEVKILLTDPFVSAEKAKEYGAEKVDVDELFQRSDIVSVHAPSLPETLHLVNAARLASMKDGATLINTSRGSLIDETALVAELHKKRIWAFLDVTDPEPPVAGSPLYGCPNLTLTPHIAGSVGRGRKRLGAMAAEELERFFAGEKPRYIVTQEMLKFIG